jgi:hypothetical protein
MPEPMEPRDVWDDSPEDEAASIGCDLCGSRRGCRCNQIEDERTGN